MIYFRQVVSIGMMLPVREVVPTRGTGSSGTRAVLAGPARPGRRTGGFPGYLLQHLEERRRRLRALHGVAAVEDERGHGGDAQPLRRGDLVMLLTQQLPQPGRSVSVPTTSTPRSARCSREMAPDRDTPRSM